MQKCLLYMLFTTGVTAGQWSVPILKWIHFGEHHGSVNLTLKTVSVCVCMCVCVTAITCISACVNVTV